MAPLKENCPFLAQLGLQILPQPPPTPRFRPPNGGPPQPATFGFEPGTIHETNPNWNVIRDLTKLRTCDPQILEWNERAIFEEWHRTTQAYEQFVGGDEDTVNARIATGRCHASCNHEYKIISLRQPHAVFPYLHHLTATMFHPVRRGS
ncbi:uncharacterized protein MYCFIDRAFT_78950 [Pseudocercospora fijiensis CIRAD86]|uniref:Uncharacterized protein n=1 Tax=Pseudocercospora fijiensis (strain CIRAD86) TaxID=383855 RepID=M3AVT9_PSEFD|nr:uncharacterized protein MYCFIDRAFT_78950 [Pseudocercospora fijiensis CIRAD86]EME81587.1 hypothetical protein MYCFIDRAFT_78950 [Pseudocercospora fijiensis CIRAD86]